MMLSGRMEVDLRLWMVLVSCSVVIEFSKGHSLFSFKEPITQLWANNFSLSIHGSSTMWIVDFYASWCGHCQRLAPEYVSLAREMEVWSDVVGVAAVVCSDPLNSVLCRTYGVIGYPTIKFFPPNSAISFHGQKFDGNKDAVGLRKAILDFLSEIIRHGTSDTTWPRFDYIRHPLELTQKNSTLQKVYIVIEDRNMEKDYVGLMVILDLIKMRSDVIVGRMKYQNSQLNGIRSHGLYALTAFGILYEVSRLTDKHGIVEKIQGDLGVQGTRRNTNSSGIASFSLPSRKYNTIYVPPKAVHVQDLESGLYYSLWIEIASQSEIKADSLRALKNYIHLLMKYHPGELHIKAFLNRTYDWLSSHKGTLSTQLWLQKLDSAQSRTTYVGKSLLWTGCRGSLPKFRGYPCSLWMTFHAITVNAYIKEITSISFDALDVLLPIREYIRYFLTCRECATNFMRSARHLEQHVRSSDDVVLWLWKSHNRLNFHLHGDITEDPTNPKVQFPSFEACPRCRTTEAASDRYNVSESSWNEDKVLRYLLHFYSEKEILNDDDLTITGTLGFSKSSFCMAFINIKANFLLNCLLIC